VIKLIKLEWLKLWPNRFFRFIIFFYVVCLPAFFLIGKAVKTDRGPFSLLNMKSFYEFPDIWEALAYAGGWMNFFFLGFIGAQLIGIDYSYKTLRQNIITGVSRSQLFFAKLLTMLSISGVATIIYVAIVFVLGFIYSPEVKTDSIINSWTIIPKYWLSCMGYMTFAFLIALLVKKTGLGLFLYMVYIMIVEPFFRWNVHGRFIEKGGSMHYYPMNALEDLTPIPRSDMLERGIKDMGIELFLPEHLAVLISLGFVSLFVFLSWWVLRRRDL